MVTLLLTFFVLIISMSSIESGKTARVAESVGRVVGVETGRTVGQGGLGETDIPTIKHEDVERRKKAGDVDPLAYRREILAGLLKSLMGVHVAPLRDGFALSFDENLLFVSGSAEITKNGQDILKALGKILLSADAFVRVEGHTDSTPVHSVQYPSNWELSMARATRIVRFLTEIENVAPERFSAAGYADTKPMASNDTPENREANRRVEMILTFTRQ
jgi:chemotaxis protein MotB